MYAKFSASLAAILLLLSAASLYGCSGGGTGTDTGTAPEAGMESGTEDSTNSAPSSVSDTGGSRPNAPTVYEPEAPQTEILGGEPLIIDISNTSQGYVMARYTGNAAKANVQITGPDGIHYKYFLAPSDSFTSLPLSSGDGTYQIDGYENISGNQYAVLFRETAAVSLENEFLPFLYPNQYVDFDAGTEAVAAASETVADASTDLDAVADIYHFVIEHVAYDTEKAETVSAGYLPDVDETLRTGRGICFDYASLTAAMLRSQNIPARLEIGYSGDVYHAWFSVYTEETGWIDRLIEFSGDGWTRMDPTLAAGNGNSSAALKYMGDGSNYTTQYIR